MIRYFILLFLMSSLYLTDQFNSIGNILISVLILMIFPIVIILKKDDLKIKTSVLWVMYFYLLACTISSLYNTDIKLLLNGVIIFALYLGSLVIVPSFNTKGIKLIFKAMFYSHIPIIIVPLLLNGLNTMPYRGVFYNPNSFGSIVATLFVALFALFTFRLEEFISGKKRIKQMLLLLIGLLFLFFLIVLSGSRTSLLASVIVMLFGFLFLTIRLIKAKKLISFIVRGTFFAGITSIVTLLVFKFTPFYDYLYMNILYKFERKSASGDVLDQRGIVWKQTIEEAGLFGHGTSYFNVSTIVGSHNTFIGILGEYGWIPLLLFLIFMLILFFSSFKYAISNVSDPYKYLPLMMILCFSMLSMGEGMMFKLSMLAMFFSSGLILKRRELSKQATKEMTPSLKKRRKLVW